MMQWPKRLGHLFLIGLYVCLAFAGKPSLAEEEPDGWKDITLEWIYQKEKLGIPPIAPDQPHDLQWSTEGHLLAYLVSYATEAPHLVIYDPAQDATAFLISPSALHDAIIRLASQPEGASIAPTPAPRPFPQEATAIARIDGYEWLKKSGGLRLHVGGKRYMWDLKANRLREDVRPELPEGEKNDVTFSPNERYAAYTRANDLYVYDLEQKKELRLTHDGGGTILNGRMTWVYWEELHYRRSWRAFEWSPDSTAIAYLQFDEAGVSLYPVVDYSNPVPATRMMPYPKTGTKNPAVRVGVVPLSTRETRWIDLGEPYEYIAEMAWHPGGQILAIQTLNRAQTQLRLLFADPVRGTSRVILEENDPAWVNAHGGPYFLEKGKGFLWLSERTGYRHLYRYSEDGKKVKALTQGEWEVNPSLWEISLPIDEAKGRVFFNASKPSPLETQFYSVSLQGGKIHPLTREPGTHDLTFSSDRRFALDHFNSLSVPQRIQVLDDKGRIIRVLGERTMEDYAPYRINIPEIVELKNADGLTFYGSLLKPFDFDPNKRYPVILHMYAGPGGRVVANQFGNRSPLDMAMVNRGFLLFRFDPRGTTHRGRAWVNAIHRNACDIPLQDLRFAVEYLKSLPYVAGDRIGIWGWSNGGYMTCAAMTKLPGVFRAGAAVAPVTDWRLYDTIYTERYMGLPDENAEGYKASAPVNFAKQLEGALLLAHGVSDDNVHIQNIYSLVDALIEAEKNYELYVYPQRDHGIGGDDRQYHLFQRIVEFFEKELKPDPTGN